MIGGVITSRSTPLAWRARLVCQVTSAKDGRFMALVFGCLTLMGTNGPGLADSSRKFRFVLDVLFLVMIEFRSNNEISMMSLLFILNTGV